MVRQFLKKGQVRRQDKGKEELARQLQEKKKCFPEAGLPQEQERIPDRCKNLSQVTRFALSLR